MQEISRTYYHSKEVDTEICEIEDGIYRISGFSGDYGITFNQFLIDDDQPTLIHTGPFGMYDKIEEKIKEVIPLENFHPKHVLESNGLFEWERTIDVECYCGHKRSSHLDGIEICLSDLCICESFGVDKKGETAISPKAHRQEKPSQKSSRLILIEISLYR